MLERAAELAGAEAAPRASPAIYPSCPEVTVAVIAVHITLERGRVTSAPAAKTCEAQKKNLVVSGSGMKLQEEPRRALPGRSEI